jgi:predicted secreted protein
MRDAIVLLFSFMLSQSCFAADGAKFRAIGFSEDRNLFAFEQYGIKDGSGFAYSDIFILDIAKDAWVKGTPIHTELEDETMDIAPVRAKAKKQAASLLASSKINVDAEILAATPYTELVKDRRVVTFHDGYDGTSGFAGNAYALGSWTVTLSSVAVPLPEGCEDDMGVEGYKLTLQSNNPTGVLTTLHEDKSLPKSRGCAVGHDIEAIVQPLGVDLTGNTQGQFVAIIGVYSRGFEGADRRFIAVPFKAN